MKNSGGIDMSRAEKVILTNMVMVYNDKGEILVQQKVDDDWTGLCFPGGHVEKGESFVMSAVREIKEETGLDIVNPKLCGVKQFYTDDDERYVVLLFKTNQFKGEIISSDEGEVFWISPESLPEYNLAVSFMEMYQVFTNEDISEQYSFLNGDQVVRALY